MTAPTHRQFSIGFAFIAAMLLYAYGITQINYYLALGILILTSKYGALFPDVDHSWENVKEKTIPNWIINHIIHLTGGKHRSWQTHSIDIVVIVSICSYVIPMVLFTRGMITDINREVLSIILLGFSSGWLSHTFSDMLTSAGVRLFCFRKKKVCLVPKKIGNLRFNTGHEWEAFCFRAAKTINIILGIVCLLFPLVMSDAFKTIIAG